MRTSSQDSILCMIKSDHTSSSLSIPSSSLWGRHRRMVAGTTSHPALNKCPPREQQERPPVGAKAYKSHQEHRLTAEAVAGMRPPPAMHSTLHGFVCPSYAVRRWPAHAPVQRRLNGILTRLKARIARHRPIRTVILGSILAVLRRNHHMPLSGLGLL